MKRLLLALSGIFLAIILGMAGYHLLSPRAVLVNDTEQTWEAFNINLPSSRVSFGPVPPGSEQTIYFSRQSRGGPIHYELLGESGVVTSSESSYEEGWELGRRLCFRIEADGKVTLEQ